jgi:hypothetical protein
MKYKSLIEKIAEFLNYLQKNDFNAKTREIKELEFKNFGRVSGLCEEAKYITQSEEYMVEFQDEKSSRSQNYQTYTITIEGIKFLEEYKKEKREETHKTAQAILNYAIFGAAFFQGVVFTAYNYFDLLSKNLNLFANIFISISLMFLTALFVLIIKFK